jgi:hypothetical protein
MITPPTTLPGKRRVPLSSFPSKTVLVCLSCLAAGARPARGQAVWMPPPTVPVIPAAVQEFQANQATPVLAPAENPLYFPGETSPFRFGPATLRPHLDYRFLYGDGIQTAPGQPRNTIVQQLSPGLSLEAGSHWSLDYTPTLSFYSASGFRDTVDHSAYIGWGGGGGDWFLHGSQSFASTSDPNVQTAAQTDEQSYTTLLGGTCQLNDKMALELGLSQELHYIGNTGDAANYQQNLEDWRSWSTMDWFSYQFWPGLGAGLGAGLGYNQQNGGPNSVYELYQARVNWRATDKLGFELSGGLQDLQYLSGGAGNLVTPIFDGSIQYQPFQRTRLRVDFSRVVSMSYYQSQTTVTTGISAGLNQRLLGRLYLDLTGGYYNTRYVASVAGLDTERTDDYYAFSASLGIPFLKRGTFAVLYQYSKNSSTQNGFAAGTSAFAYASNQVGFEIGYRY